MENKQELEDFIAQEKQQGLSNEEIQQKLLRAGWDTDDVRQAFTSTEAPPQSSQQEVAKGTASQAIQVTGLSGNEIYCLDDVGFKAGDISVGNSVHALGVMRSIGSSFKGFVGGEITQFTALISEGRETAISRLEAETVKAGGAGVTGVTTEIITTGSNLEFLSVGSLLYKESPGNEQPFSSSADGQELYCQIDAGYTPRRFVFGNVAYSIGAGKGIVGAFRQLVRGEVSQYTEIFNKTRSLALDRIIDDAKKSGANAVVNIRVQIIPISGSGYGMQEMIMMGTASHNPNIPAEYTDKPITSDLINQELWSMTKKGYMPLKLVMGTSVYSLGFIGGITSYFKSFRKGEIPELTKLIYEAREKSISKIKAEATSIGADNVVGTKVYLYELGGGLIEVLAIGTAMKKAPVSTRSSSLIAQAIINDKDTLVDLTHGTGVDLSKQSPRVGKGLIGGIISTIFVILIIALQIYLQP